MKNRLLLFLTGIGLILTLNQCEEITDSGINSTGASPASSMTEASPRENAGRPALVAPENNAENQSTTVELLWEEPEMGEKYHIKISETQDFSSTVVDTLSDENSYSTESLKEETIYYWKILSVESSSEWSEIRQFQTGSAESETEIQSQTTAVDDFVNVENASFTVDGETFRFAGTNAYYLPNYENLDPGVVDRAFDAFEEIGITVVRMWAFYDGYDCGYSRHDSSENVIQTAPGEYSESALQDLDRVIAKGKERGIRFILPFVNYWDELGGICQYNTWAGASDPGQNTSFFINNPDTQEWYRDYIEMLLNRVNTVTGVAYKDESAIFSWQIMNEGRNRGADPQEMRDWYQEIARFIKSIDSNHMVTTGEDGFDENTPSEYSLDQYSNRYVLQAGEGTSYTMNIAIPEIDYGNAHWYAEEFGFGSSVNQSMLDAQQAWIKDHSSIAKDHGKPFVLGEYGHEGFGDSSVMEVYEDLWSYAEEIQLDGSTIWQLTADNTKCYEFGGNICYPGGRGDYELFERFRSHITTMSNSN